VKEVGDIFVRMEFLGPPGIAYPQFRPEMDSFDDQLRIAPKKVVEEGEVVAKPVISTVPDETPDVDAQRAVAVRLEKSALGELPPEFTEVEILAAFKVCVYVFYVLLYDMYTMLLY
jgi:hypothetical protein